ncbi:MAG: hypothetical protein H6811_10535 [Phycisphaeraceae bacterium]|nr:hypothetical protein [Phycisphaeraceae bacterium]
MIGAADQGRGVLFTAFEPSGDDHASIVIAELRRRHPDLPIYAWGGPKMERAGATIIERTGDDAVMGMPGLKKIREHKRMNQRIASWMREYPVAVHVPVDSPAANFPICKIAKRQGIRVVHLVAPQLWAWGAWRIGKLRRRTDMVLCLLPFEENWFRDRDLEARFIGHPLFDAPLDLSALDAAASDLPSGSPRLALLPGSRPGEIAKNFPILLAAFRSLLASHPGASGVVAATTPEVAQRLRDMAAQHGGWPDGLDVRAGATDVIARWCDLALVVSGTVTLQLAKQAKPMVVFYKSSPIAYTLIARWVIETEFLTLPNLIAGREIVPEFVPHFGDERDIVAAADRLLRSPQLADRQRNELQSISAQFLGRSAGAAAADAIEQVMSRPARPSAA